MNKVCSFVLIVLMTFVSANAFSAAESPRDIVKNTTEQVVTRIKNDRDALRQDPAQMFQLVSELIFPHFDFPIMAQWVLGAHWKDADTATREEFIGEFRKLLVRTYAAALLEFSDQKISYPDLADESQGRTTLVKQQIEQAGGDSIDLGYRLHNTSGQWKVLDVTVDGVSLVKTYRASFASIIKDGGVASLIQTLNEKNKEIE